MKKLITTAALSIAMMTSAAFASAETGATAPAFEATTASGKIINLSDYEGKHVVLEWTNEYCPFVKKHYETGNMQKLQTAAKADGIVWLSVLSSAEGKQGYKTAEQALATAAKHEAHPTEVILDASGAIGKAYGAKTTPHVFLIDPEGKVVYQGAIDNNSSADKADVATASNYLTAAIAAQKAGTPIENATTTPYGCSVKY